MLDDERRRVADSVAELAVRTPGRSGNLSVRRGSRFAITPTGIPYEAINADDVAVVDVEDGAHLEGKAPSSETPMHTAVYRELDVDAVVHTHSPWSTIMAVLRRPIPPVHYLLAAAGSEVPVADYASYGTADLAENAVEALLDAGSTACLLANHGLLVTGATLDETFETLDNVEFTARLYVQATGIGDPVELSEEEMARVAADLANYGQPE